MNDRIRKLTDECRERTRFMKFLTYAKAAGLGSASAEDDRYYSAEQASFFAQYEEQLVTDVYLARLLGEL